MQEVANNSELVIMKINSIKFLPIISFKKTPVLFLLPKRIISVKIEQNRKQKRIINISINKYIHIFHKQFL